MVLMKIWMRHFMYLIFCQKKIMKKTILYYKRYFYKLVNIY